MNLQNLLTGEEDEIAAGSVFRVKAEWPYEEIVDFMLLYLPSESSTHALIVCTGMKAGRVLIKLPPEADCGGRAISKDWLIRKWDEWVYPQCAIEDVLVARRFRGNGSSQLLDSKSAWLCIPRKDLLNMYYLIIWDKWLAATGQDGCLRKLEIPIDLAKFFFRLESGSFPVLSQLSFDDYDLFSDTQLELLIQELQNVPATDRSITDQINSMVQVIRDAKSLGKSILFDPFRRD